MSMTECRALTESLNKKVAKCPFPKDGEIFLEMETQGAEWNGGTIYIVDR